MKNLDIGTFPAVVGVGAYLPPEIVTNDELVARTNMDSSDEAIRRLTQIEQRHFCAEGELPSAMGVIAVTRALESARMSLAEMGGMYVSAMAKDMLTPDTAVIMHGKLRDMPDNCLAVDLGAACAGGVVSLYEAVNRTRAERTPTLAVGLGKMSGITDFDDRRSAILFGDGSGAFVVDECEDVLNPAFAFRTVSDTKAICIPGGGEQRPLQDPDDKAGKIQMQGRIVAGYARKLIPETAIEAAQKAGFYDHKAGRIDWDKITAVVPHQPNGNLLADIATELQIPAEKIVLTVYKHANTSAASIPLALAQAQREGRFDPNGRNIVLSPAIGAGMKAATAIYQVRIPQ